MLDLRYPEDFPDSQLTDVPYSNTASKSAEEERPQIPKKVSVVELGLLLQIQVLKIFKLVW